MFFYYEDKCIENVDIYIEMQLYSISLPDVFHSLSGVEFIQNSYNQ